MELQAALNFQQLGLEVGGSALVGALIGFAAKKVAKIIAVLVGAELVLFKFLESRGIISVDWDRLTAGLVGAGEQAAEAPSYVVSLVSTLGVGAGFAGGFLLGFKRA